MDDVKIIDFGFRYKLMNLYREEDIDKAKDLLHLGEISGVSLYEINGERIHNLEKLRVLSKSKALVVNLSDSVDLSFMEEFSQLEMITFYRKARTGLDFSKYANLIEVYVDENIFREIPISISRNIKILDIRGISGANLSVLKHCDNLESLSIYESRKLISLDQIGHLIKLKELDVGYCSKLVDISALMSLKSLNRLLLRNNKNITTYDSIGELVNLTKLQIFSSATIESLNFLSNLSLLKMLVIDATKILSTDNSVLSKLVSADYMYIYPPKLFKQYYKGL